MGQMKAEQAPTIGARQVRAEDPRLLTGRGVFVGDIVLPGMLEVAFVRSNSAHARIDNVRYDFAVSIDGVESVLVAEDLPAIGMTSPRHPDLLLTPQSPLAVDKVRFAGEAVAMVLAEDRYIAEDAAELVEVDYVELPAVGDTDRDGELIFDHIPGNVVFKDVQKYGAPDEAFANAALVVKKNLHFARQLACPLEPRGCVADYDASSKRLKVYSSTQSPHRLRRDLSGVVGLPENQIKVVMHDIGGAFGQKIPTHLEEVAVVLASMLTGRPVKWIEDRQENLIAAPHARGQQLEVQLALDGEQKFIGLRSLILGDAGAYSFNSGSCLTESYRTARALPGVYAISNYSYDVTIRLTNRAPIAPYRGVGFVAAQAVRELLIDEAARALSVDRFELRRRNMVTPAQVPYTTCTGWVYNEASFQETLVQARQLLDNPPADVQAGALNILRGVGISPFVEPSGVGGEGGMQVHGFRSPSHDAARVVVDTSGRATVCVGTPSMGQGLETTMAQVAAESLGFELEDVIVSWGDTSTAPLSLTGARASRSAVVSGGAVMRAARDVRDQILKVAGNMLEADPADLVIRGSAVWVAGESRSRMSVPEAVRGGYFDDSLRDSELDRTFEATRLYDPPGIYSNACVIAVVDVHTDTGAVEIRRLIGVEDCGTMINPMIVEGQFIGGVAQGIGSALLERVFYSDDGQPATSTLMDYLLPTATDTLRVELGHVETASRTTEGGIKGMGEGGMIGTVAAIACAVADAVAPAGGVVDRLPLLPHVVWELLEAADCTLAQAGKGE